MAPTSVARLERRLNSQRPSLAVTGVQKNQVITNFLRYFVGDDGQRCDNTKFGTLQKSSGDQDAIDKIVKSITDQDQ
jgi:hypothetical protein